MSGTEKNNKFSLADLFFDQHLQNDYENGWQFYS